MTAPMKALSKCWPTIEQYMDVESLVSASKSCHTLHSLIIHATTGKIKASVVKIDTWPACIDAYNKEQINWLSAPARIRHYAPSVINAIHFPSLVRMRIGFPPDRTTWNGEERLTENAHVVALPMLARKLNDAIRLEELVIDIQSLIKYETRLLGEGEIRHPNLYSILGENLARSIGRSCSFKRLTILNEGMLEVDGIQSKFSSAFLAAMIPVLRAGINSLEEVTILCGAVPLSKDHHPDAGTKFFTALFSLRRLKTLRIQLKSIHGPLLNALVDASTASGTFSSRYLEEISIMVPRSIAEDGRPLCSRTTSIAPFLRTCRNASSLRRCVVYVPFWDEESVRAMKYLFHGKPLLNELVANFHGYEDEDGVLLQCLAEFLQRRPSLSGLRIVLKGLGYVDEDSAEFAALRWYQSRDGEMCLRGDVNCDWK
eukprot:CAMPEP_0196153848 /NCGR_PEP_ID=MMETSP0910-20130528/37917_1 /TAXON_ID=49265 /ORGANISM="Thalassiosira rotula, Strain GSO102" /LENGTH=428 /DNA_ID=CAMNT_0041417753 /DNA_START=119 /DNA_END=1402 /DNA_ORIENTATION=-